MAIEERFKGANVIDAGKLSPYWGEHVARYSFALPLVQGKRVLDIACGTGYGLALLHGAQFVVGVDIDVEALRAARESSQQCAVTLADALNLPFADQTFDAITSFETLEHLAERRPFLGELARVLRPDGVLILSTPNANYSRPVNGKPRNPYHIHEYSPAELRGELAELFTIERFVGQTLDRGAGITPFYDAQLRLPKYPVTQMRLFGWKVFNKLPFGARESLSGLIWGKPFYPTEKDYNFEERTVDDAVTLVAVCCKT
jgi:SAM-dependent methyltransferase